MTGSPCPTASCLRLSAPGLRPRGAGFLCVAALLVLVAAPSGLDAQVADPGNDLATIFDLGRLVADTNGDEVPDAVQASLLYGDAPSTAELAAAAEISARLGFETMAMDLPILRGDGGAIQIGRAHV